MTGPVPLGVGQLAAASALILVNGLLSLALGLGLGRRLAVAAVRTVVQLSVMGLVLVPVFRWSRAAPVLLLCCAMVVLAGWESLRRTERVHRRALLGAVAGLGVGAAGTAVLGTAAILRVDPWWTPQYLVPLVGMVLGNALTGVSLGMDRFLAQVAAGRGRVEWLLAMGAGRWEACRAEAAVAIRAGMVPILNAMNVVGLVTMPGMMTGQILAGADPGVAVRYQVFIMFLIAAAVGLGSTVAVLVAVATVVDRRLRLRTDRIRARDA